MTALYVPGTSETDQSKLIMSQQLVASQTSTNTDSIATNTTNITTNTTNIASNTTAITALQTAGTGLTNVAGSLAVSLSKITASLSGDVALNNTGTYFDGPSIAQGSTGTWWVSGSVTIGDTAGAATFDVRLSDGTTVIDSTETRTQGASNFLCVHLSGYLASPAANLRIQVKDTSATTGVIKFNQSGNSKDSTISAIRIA